MSCIVLPSATSSSTSAWRGREQGALPGWPGNCRMHRCATMVNDLDIAPMLRPDRIRIVLGAAFFDSHADPGIGVLDRHWKTYCITGGYGVTFIQRAHCAFALGQGLVLHLGIDPCP